MSGVIFPDCPKWATGVFASMEFMQDSGVPLDVWVAAAFAVRLQRGVGKANVIASFGGQAASTPLQVTGASLVSIIATSSAARTS